MSKSVGGQTIHNYFRLSAVKWRKGSSFSQRRPRSVSNQKKEYENSVIEHCVINSIKKAVKANDITLLLGDRRQKLRTEINAHDGDKETIIHQQLIEVRKKYDDMKKQRANKFNQNLKLKERLKSISVSQSEYRNAIDFANQFNKTGKTRLQQSEEAVEEIMNQKKSLLHMRKRLTSDIIFNKDQDVAKNIVLKSLKQQIKYLAEQRESLENEVSSVILLREKVEREVSEEYWDRKEHLSHVEEKIEIRNSMEREKEQWDDFKTQAAIESLQAKDEEERNWQKLMLVHLLLKSILKWKMFSEMNKFQVFEGSFRKIKNRTSVKETEQFIYRFLNRDEIYGSLLSQVSQCKTRLEQIKIQQAKMIDQNQRLNSVQQEMMNLFYFSSGSGNSRQGEKRIREWIMRQRKMEQNKTIFSEWIARSNMKLAKVYQKWGSSSSQMPKGIDQLKDTFMEYLMRMKQIISEINEQEVDFSNHSLYIEQCKSECCPLEQSPQRNLINSSPQPHQNSSIMLAQQRKHQPEAYRSDEEDMHIEAQREHLIKKNHRFMNESRIKIMQAKKMKIDKQTKPHKM